MGSVGACYDNAVAETFFATPQERARQPPHLAQSARAAVRDLRLHRGVPQPPAPALHPEHALPNHLRTATTLPARRLRAMARTRKINVNKQPKVSRKPGQVHAPGSFFARTIASGAPATRQRSDGPAPDRDAQKPSRGPAWLPARVRGLSPACSGGSWLRLSESGSVERRDTGPRGCPCFVGAGARHSAWEAVAPAEWQGVSSTEASPRRAAKPCSIQTPGSLRGLVGQLEARDAPRQHWTHRMLPSYPRRSGR
jgi:hypothetical protein